MPNRRPQRPQIPDTPNRPIRRSNTTKLLLQEMKHRSAKQKHALTGAAMTQKEIEAKSKK